MIIGTCRMLLTLYSQFAMLGWVEVEPNRYRYVPPVHVGAMDVRKLVQPPQNVHKTIEVVVTRGVIPICADKIILVLPKGTPA